MFKKLKEILIKKYNLVPKTELDNAITSIEVATFSKDKLMNDLIQKELGSILVGDVDFFIKLDDTQRREFCQSISAIWNDKLKVTIESYIEKQKDFIVKQALDHQIVFAKGTINGMYLLYDFFEQCHKEHKANIMPKESFDKHFPFPE